MKSAISVYGGTGFVGRHFCEVSSRPIVLIPREERAPQSSESLYLISTTHNYHVFDDRHQDVAVNLTVLLDVLDQHIQDKKLRDPNHVFNFISSWFVYGETDLPAHEESVCAPKGFYSITKRTAEQLLVSFCETFDLKYRILRLCNVYGPGDAGVSKQKNALQYLINQIKKHEDVNLYHDGDFYRDYMHVKDVARAIDLCLEKAPFNQIINIGSGEKLQFRRLIEHVVQLTGSKSKLIAIEPPAFHKAVQVKDFYMDNRRLRELGFEPKIAWQKGIEELCR